ncbi:MAG: polyprenyl synthetase family protein, partial [Pyrinomonadaceae bacterium]
MRLITGTTVSMASANTRKYGLNQFIELHKAGIEMALKHNLPLAPPEIETKFNEAVRYLLFPGGKRLRPVLTMLGAELLGGKATNVMHAAAAVEYIHTSSLIFDDLPCMDNSEERRGRLALHERFGQGLSTLVAIGLLNHSYRLVTVDGR